MFNDIYEEIQDLLPDGMDYDEFENEVMEG